jgi:hypothetical protein
MKSNIIPMNLSLDFVTKPFSISLLAIVFSLALWTSFAVEAQSYEVIKVINGATLEGTVHFKGSVPAAETIVINEDVEFCGQDQQTGKYLVSDSAVKNVVVWLEGIEKGRAVPQKSVDVTIRKCRAAPHVNVGFVGGQYMFRNDDDILHTVQLKLGLAYQEKVSGRQLQDGATIYNLALPKTGTEIKKPIKKWHRYTDQTGFIQVRSNIHNWIRGYIFIFDHPYAAVTDEKGAFVMKDLPAGEYILKVWHEGFGLQEKKIEVTPGEALEVGIAFAQ